MSLLSRWAFIRELPANRVWGTLHREAGWDEAHAQAGLVGSEVIGNEPAK